MGHRWLRRQARSLSASACLAGILVVLLGAAPALPSARTAGELRGWLAGSSPDQVTVALAVVGGWLCLCWLTTGALLVALGRLPGAVGTLCAGVGARLTPALLRRAVEGVLGTALAGTALVGTSLATPLGAHGAAPAFAADSSTAAGPVGRFRDGWPDLDRPARGTAAATVPPAARPQRRAGTAQSPEVVVRAGDTLWGIARRALNHTATPASVALSWPKWHVANRAVIGPDPDLLRPGQRLRPPPGPQQR